MTHEPFPVHSTSRETHFCRDVDQVMKVWTLSRDSFLFAQQQYLQHLSTGERAQLIFKKSGRLFTTHRHSFVFLSNIRWKRSNLRIIWLFFFDMLFYSWNSPEIRTTFRNNCNQFFVRLNRPHEGLHFLKLNPHHLHHNAHLNVLPAIFINSHLRTTTTIPTIIQV